MRSQFSLTSVVSVVLMRYIELYYTKCSIMQNNRTMIRKPRLLKRYALYGWRAPRTPTEYILLPTRGIVCTVTNDGGQGNVAGAHGHSIHRCVCMLFAPVSLLRKERFSSERIGYHASVGAPPADFLDRSSDRLKR